MQVTIKPAGNLMHMKLGQGLRTGPVTLPDEATVADALAWAGVPPDTPLMVTLNGELARPDQPLREGDVIGLVPPISGGTGDERSRSFTSVS
jgi:sulfur carrier protein ThiS